jgi:hypothetical protein
MNPLLGRWRIKKSELCGEDELEREGAARLDLELGSGGRIRMGRLEGEIDWRGRESAGGWQAHFTWVGSLDGERASGRGWIRLVERGRLQGKIFVHGGDDPRFHAVRI